MIQWGDKNKDQYLEHTAYWTKQQGRQEIQDWIHGAVVFLSWYYPMRTGLVGAWHRTGKHTWWGTRNPKKRTDSFFPDTRSFKSRDHYRAGIKPAGSSYCMGIFRAGVDSSTHRLRDSWSQAMQPPMSTAVQGIPWPTALGKVKLGTKTRIRPKESWSLVPSQVFLSIAQIPKLLSCISRLNQFLMCAYQ